MKRLARKLFENLHWIVTIFLIFYVAIAFLSPIMFELGHPRVGWWIQTAYRFLCHQRAERSLFLFGEQLMYTTEELTNSGYKQYLIGFPFVGNETLGYKVAFCVRDIAIYTSMALTGIFVGFSSKKITVKWWIAALATIPMALDGGIQFVSEFLFLAQNSFGLSISEPFYLSNYVTRAITGSIFGIGVGLFIFTELKDAVKNDSKTN